MRRPHAAFLGFLLAYGAFLCLELDQYGPTWDALLEYPRATAYVDHWLSGRTSPDETPAELRAPWHEITYDEARSDSQSCNGCLPSLFAALGGKIFFEWLGLLGAIDAFHLGLVLLWLACLSYLYVRIAELHSPAVALVATVILGLSPRVLGHVPNNMKDVPAAAFLAMALLDFLVGVVRSKPRRLYASALFFGCAVAAKFTSALGLVPMALTFWATFRRNGILPYVPRGYRLPLAVAPLLAAGVLVGHWPYLWVPPGEAFGRLAEVIRTCGGRHASGIAFDPYAPWMTAVTTPPVVLAAALIGLLPARRTSGAGREPGPAFYLLWIAAILLPWSSGVLWGFDGIRQMLHLWPALAILAAVGLRNAARLALTRTAVSRRALRLLAAPAVAAALVYPVVVYHPYETTYFNCFVGGLPGAARTHDGANDYWGSSLRNGMRWADEHLPRGAKLHVGEFFAHLAGYSKTRDDVELSSGSVEDPSRLEYVIFVTRAEHYTEVEPFVLEHGEPIHDVQVLGVPLTRIYRIRPR